MVGAAAAAGRLRAGLLFAHLLLQVEHAPSGSRSPTLATSMTRTPSFSCRVSIAAAKGNFLRGAVVCGGWGVHAFEEEEQREEQRGEVEKRHDLHQVVVQELCREGARAVQHNERGASDSEGGDAVAPELKMCELTQ